MFYFVSKISKFIQNYIFKLLIQTTKVVSDKILTNYMKYTTQSNYHTKRYMNLQIQKKKIIKIVKKSRFPVKMSIIFLLSHLRRDARVNDGGNNGGSTMEATTGGGKQRGVPWGHQ